MPEFYTAHASHLLNRDFFVYRHTVLEREPIEDYNVVSKLPVFNKALTAFKKYPEATTYADGELRHYMNDYYIRSETKELLEPHLHNQALLKPVLVVVIDKLQTIYSLYPNKKQASVYDVEKSMIDYKLRDGSNLRMSIKESIEAFPIHNVIDAKYEYVLKDSKMKSHLFYLGDHLTVSRELREKIEEAQLTGFKFGKSLLM